MFAKKIAKTNLKAGFSSVKNFSSFWGHVKQRPADPILGLVEEFKNCKESGKVNLTAGTYKTNEGTPYVLNCVKAAQKKIVEGKYDMEYLPIEGLGGFIKNSVKLAYGEDSLAIKENRVVGLQSLSGTGSLLVGMKYFAEFYPKNKKVLIPNPSWPNHKNVANAAGLEWEEFRYYDNTNKNIDMDGLLQDLDKAEDGSIVLLHVCAHNPTGMDPSREQWDDIYNVIKKKGHFPFFDMAYQGFASGDLEKDCYALRKFSNSGMRLALAQSYAKNFGLYGQRVGCFSMITDSAEECQNVMSQAKFIARALYSNPPKHGALIVDIVLSDPELTQEWHRELGVMSGRIATMRQALFDKITANSTLNWDHIINQIGMFAYTGFTLDQVKTIKAEKHIFLTNDGRISVAGLNTSNIDYVAKSFDEISKRGKH